MENETSLQRSARLYYSGEIRRLKHSRVTPESKAKILEFIQDCRLQGLSQHRLNFYLQRLRRIALMMGDAFLAPSEKDTKRVIAQLQEKQIRSGSGSDRKHYSPATIEIYRVSMAKFYRWLLREERPECLAWMKGNGKAGRMKAPEDMLTQQELEKLIGACTNARDRAFFAFMYDTGVRISEALGVKVKDLRFDELGAIAHIGAGKSDYRQVRFVGDSVALIRQWSLNHPAWESESYVFCGITGRNRGRQMNYWDASQRLRRAVAAAGLKKRVHFHLFRHTRATTLSSKLTESVLGNMMGWRPGSRMSATYVHLNRGDVDRQVLQAYGLQPKEQGAIGEPRPKACPRCSSLNVSGAEYCRQCWLPLTDKGLMQMQELTATIEKTLDRADVISDDMKAVLASLPADTKDVILTAVLEQIAKDPERVKAIRSSMPK